MSAVVGDFGSADSSSGGGQPWGGLLNLAGTVEQGFAAYETADAAKTAAKQLNSKDLTYVLLGLGVIAVIGLFVFKH